MTFTDRVPRLGSIVLLTTVGSACCLGVDETTSSVGEALSAGSASDRAALAFHWAAIHYQDVDQSGLHALGGAADYITRVDFDGDLNARNSWENAGSPSFPLAAHAYDSVVKTSSHWYVV
jgi:hypothetical protein